MLASDEWMVLEISGWVHRDVRSANVMFSPEVSGRGGG